MDLTDLEKKKIGENIKLIRLANGLSADSFANLLGISTTKLQHLENGSYKANNWDIDLLEVSKVSGFSVEQIKYENLSKYLEKNSLDFGTKIKATEFFDVLDFPDILSEVLSHSYPLIKPDNIIESKSFDEAYSLAKESIEKCETNEELCKRIMCGFNDAYKKDNIISACVNSLSYICFYYGFYVTNPSVNSNINKFEKIESDNYASMLSEVRLSLNMKDLPARKRAFFDEYNDTIESLINIIKLDGSYNDYLSFYIMNRYQMAMFDNDEVKMSDEDMKKFGLSLLKNLEECGNKYAVNLQNAIKKATE